MGAEVTEARSRLMSKVGQKNTGPEMILRSALHRSGLRYRLHAKDLPGTPDLVFPRFEAVVFVHRCFWHSHGCQKSTVPKSNREFWEQKFRANRERDERKIRALLKRGWRVLVVWECSLVGKHAPTLNHVVRSVKTWLEGSDTEHELPTRFSTEDIYGCDSTLR